MKYLRAYYASSLKDKIIGLIGKEKIEPLFFETRFGIHTFGMKKPIDVIILDNNNIIKVVKKSLQPNRIFLWSPAYKKVLELPLGTINAKKLQLGEVLEF